MALIVVGGHTRNIGKTSVVAGIIAAMPEMRWTAIKITQFGHGVCSANGEACGCETAEHTVAVSEERVSDSGTDTSRYLSAGAVRSLWVRTRQGQLAEAMPRIRREIALAENAIVESNSILRFMQPDFYASVLDPGIPDFKGSALRYLDRANALLMAGEDFEGRTGWSGVSPAIMEGIPKFRIVPPEYCPDDFLREVAKKCIQIAK